MLIFSHLFHDTILFLISSRLFRQMFEKSKPFANAFNLRFFVDVYKFSN